jgi:pimeloyl-ACP methyl ester carboxylesterase
MPEIRLRGGEVDGLAMHYLVEGRGPAVVLVHGLGGFAETWRHNLPALAARATVYAVDLPGFGRSAKPAARYDLPYFARVLHAFGNTLGLPQVSLVGHSMGGAVCVTYALMHPSRVERLALVGAIVPGFRFPLSWGHRLATRPGVGEALALCACAPLIKAAIARCFWAPVRSEVDFLVDTDYRDRTGSLARAAWLAAIRALRTDLVVHRDDFRRALDTLDIPVLLVHGRQDGAVPPAHCADAVEGLPRAAVRWLDGCGHFPHIEHASVVNGWLGEFLVGRTAPSR